MHYSIFLARFLGLIFTIMCLGLLFNRQHFHQIAENLEKMPGVQLLATILPLGIGSWLITTHNTWMGWPTIITVIGWLFFAAGVFRSFFPKVWIAVVHKKKDSAIPAIAGFIFLIVGLVLLYFGYF